MDKQFPDIAETENGPSLTTAGATSRYRQRLEGGSIEPQFPIVANPMQRISNKAGSYVMRGQSSVRTGPIQFKSPLANQSHVNSSVLVHEAIRSVKRDLSEAAANQIRALSNIEHDASKRQLKADAIQSGLQTRFAILDKTSLRTTLSYRVGPVTSANLKAGIDRAKALVITQIETQLQPVGFGVGQAASYTKAGAFIPPPASSITRPAMTGILGASLGQQLTASRPSIIPDGHHFKWYANFTKLGRPGYNGRPFGNLPVAMPFNSRPYGMARDDLQMINKMSGDEHAILASPESTPAQKQQAEVRLNKYGQRYGAIQNTRTPHVDPAAHLVNLERERLLLQDARRIAMGNDVYTVMATSAVSDVRQSAAFVGVSHKFDEYGQQIPEDFASARQIQSARSYTSRFLSTHRMNGWSAPWANAKDKSLNSNPAIAAEGRAELAKLTHEGAGSYSGTPGRLFGHSAGFKPGVDEANNYTGPAYGGARSMAAQDYVKGLEGVIPTLDLSGVPLERSVPGQILGSHDPYMVNQLQDIADQQRRRQAAALTALSYVKQMSGFFQPADHIEIKAKGGVSRPTENEAIRRLEGGAHSSDDGTMDQYRYAGSETGFDEANDSMLQYMEGGESVWSQISHNPGQGNTGNQKASQEASANKWSGEQIDFAAAVNAQRQRVATNVLPHLIQRAADEARRGNQREAARLNHVIGQIDKGLSQSITLGTDGASAYTLPYHRDFESSYYASTVNTSSRRFRADDPDRDLKLANLKEINDEYAQRVGHNRDALDRDDAIYADAINFQGRERGPDAAADLRRIAPQTSSYELGRTGTGTIGGLYGRMRNAISNELGEQFLEFLPSDYQTPGGLSMPFNPIMATVRGDLESGAFGGNASKSSRRIRSSSQFRSMAQHIDRLSSGKGAMSPHELLEIARQRTASWSSAHGDPGSERARWMSADPMALYGEIFGHEISELSDAAFQSNRTNSRLLSGNRWATSASFRSIEKSMGRTLTTADFFTDKQTLGRRNPLWGGEDFTSQDSIIWGAQRLGRKLFSPLHSQKTWDAESQRYVQDSPISNAIQGLRGTFGLGQEYFNSGIWAARKRGDNVKGAEQRYSEGLAKRTRLFRLQGVHADIQQWLHDAQQGGITNSRDSETSLGLLDEDTLVDPFGNGVHRDVALQMGRELQSQLFSHRTLDEATPYLAAFLGGKTSAIGGSLIQAGTAAPAHAPPTGTQQYPDHRLQRRNAQINQLETSAVLNAAWETIFGASDSQYSFPRMDPRTREFLGDSDTGTLAQHDVSLSEWALVNDNLKRNKRKALPAVWGMIGGQKSGGSLTGGEGFGIQGIQTVDQARQFQASLKPLMDQYRASKGGAVKFKVEDLWRINDVLNWGQIGPHASDEENSYTLIERLKGRADEGGYVTFTNESSRYGVGRGSHSIIDIANKKMQINGSWKTMKAGKTAGGYTRGLLENIYDQYLDTENPESALGGLIRDRRVMNHIGGANNFWKLGKGDDQALHERSAISPAIWAVDRLKEFWAKNQQMGIVHPAIAKSMNRGTSNLPDGYSIYRSDDGGYMSMIDPDGNHVAGIATDNVGEATAHFGRWLKSNKLMGKNAQLVLPMVSSSPTTAPTLPPIRPARLHQPTTQAPAAPSYGTDQIVPYSLRDTHDATISSDARFALQLYQHVLGKPFADMSDNVVPFGIAQRGRFDPDTRGAASHNNPLNPLGKPWDEDQLQAMNLGRLAGSVSPVIVATAGSGKTAVEGTFPIRDMLNGRLKPEEWTQLISFATKTVEQTGSRLKGEFDKLGVGNDQFERYMSSGGVTTMHSLGLRSIHKIGVSNVLGVAGEDLVEAGFQRLNSGEFADLGGLSNLVAMRDHANLVEVDARGISRVRQGQKFSNILQADKPHLIEVFREAVHELANDHQTMYGADEHAGISGQPIAEYLEQHFSDQIPYIEGGSTLRRGASGGVRDRDRTIAGLEAGMSDKEKKLFERMEWYQGHGLPSAGLLDALDPVSGTGLRQPGASTVGNSEDWFAVLIGQRIDQILQRGALVKGESGKYEPVRYYRPSDMINKPLAYMDRPDFSPDELGGLYGRKMIITEAQDTSLGEDRFADKIAGGGHNVLRSGDPEQDLFAFKGGSQYNFRQRAKAAAKANALVRLRTNHRQSVDQTIATNLLHESMVFFDEATGKYEPLMPRDSDIVPGPGANIGRPPIVVSVGVNDMGSKLSGHKMGGGEVDQYGAIAEMIRHLTGQGMTSNVQPNERAVVHGIDPHGAMAGGFQAGNFAILAKTNEEVASAVETMNARGQKTVAWFAKEKLNRWQELDRTASFYGITPDVLDEMSNFTNEEQFHTLLNPSGDEGQRNKLNEFLANVLDPSADLIGSWHSRGGGVNFGAVSGAIRNARRNLSLPHRDDGTEYLDDWTPAMTIHSAKNNQFQNPILVNATERRFPMLGKDPKQARDSLGLFTEAVGRALSQAFVFAAQPTQQQIDAHGRATGLSGKGLDLAMPAKALDEFNRTGGIKGGSMSLGVIGDSRDQFNARARLASTPPAIGYNPSMPVPMSNLPAATPVQRSGPGWRRSRTDGTSMQRLNPLVRSFDQMANDWAEHLKSGKAFGDGGTIDPLSLQGDHAIVAEAGPEYIVMGDKSVLVDEPTALPKAMFKGRRAQVIPAGKAQKMGRDVAGRLGLGLGVHPAFANGTPDILMDAGVAMQMDMAHPQAAWRLREAQALLQAGSGAEVGADPATGLLMARGVSRDRMALSRDAATALSQSPHFAGMFQSPGSASMTDAHGNALPGSLVGQHVKAFDSNGDPQFSIIKNLDQMVERIKYVNESLDLLGDTGKSAAKVMDAISSGQYHAGEGGLLTTLPIAGQPYWPDASHMTTGQGEAYRHPISRVNSGRSEYYDPITRSWSANLQSGPMIAQAAGEAAPPAQAAQVPTVGGDGGRTGGTSSSGGSSGRGGGYGHENSVSHQIISSIIYNGVLNDVERTVEDMGDRLDKGVAQRSQDASQRNRLMAITGFQPTPDASGHYDDAQLAQYRGVVDSAYDVNRSTFEAMGYSQADVAKMTGDMSAAGGFAIDPKLIANLDESTKALTDAQNNSADYSVDQLKALETKKTADEGAITSAYADREANFARISYAGEMNAMNGTDFGKLVVTTGAAAGLASERQSDTSREAIAGMLIEGANKSPFSLEDYAGSFKYMGPTLMPQLSTTTANGRSYDTSMLAPGDQADQQTSDSIVKAAQAAALVTRLSLPGVSDSQVGRAVNMFQEAARDPNIKQSTIYAQSVGAIDTNFRLNGVGGGAFNPNSIGIASFNPDGTTSGTSQSTWDPQLLGFAGKYISDEYDLNSERTNITDQLIDLGWKGVSTTGALNLPGSPGSAKSPSKIGFTDMEGNAASRALATQDAGYTTGGQTYHGKLAIEAENIDIASAKITIEQAHMGKSFAASSAAFGANANVQRQDFAEYARQLEFSTSPEVTKQRREAFEATQAQAADSLSRQQRGVSATRFYEDALYGAPGSDQSFAAYVSASRNQALAGQGSQFSQLAGAPVDASAIGLENQMGFRSLEHSRAGLIFGQSSLNAGAQFEENMKYLDFQQGYLEEKNAIGADYRGAQRGLQDEDLDQALDVLQKSQKYARTMFEDNERHMQVEAGLIDDRRSAMEANLAVQQLQLDIEKEMLPIRQAEYEQMKKTYELQALHMVTAAQEAQNQANKAIEVSPYHVALHNAQGAEAQGRGFGADAQGHDKILSVDDFYGPIAELSQQANAAMQAQIKNAMSDSIQSMPVLPGWLGAFQKGENGNYVYQNDAQESLFAGGQGVGPYVDPQLQDPQATRAAEVATREQNKLDVVGAMDQSTGEAYEWAKNAYSEYENKKAGTKIPGTDIPIGSLSGFAGDATSMITAGFVGKSIWNILSRGKGAKAAVPLVDDAIGAGTELAGGGRLMMGAKAIGPNLMKGAGVGLALGLGGMAGDSILGHYGVETNGALSTIGTAAGVGAMVGSVVPVLGTGVGAAVGGAIGGGIVAYQNREAIGAWAGDHGMGADDIQRYSDEFAEWLNKTGKSIVDFGSKIFDGAVDLGGDILTAFLDPGDFLKDHAPESLQGVAELIGNIMQAFTNPIGFIQEGLPDIYDSAGNMVSGVAGWFTSVGDAISEFFEDHWDDMVGIGARIAGWVTNIPDTLIERSADAFAGAENLGKLVLNAMIIDPVNAVLKTLSGMKIDTHIPGVGTIGMPDLGQIDHFASGTAYAPGGLAMVGEHGPEIVGLPRGSSVANALDSRNLMDIFLQGRTADTRGRLFSDGPGAISLSPMASRNIAGNAGRNSIEKIEVNINLNGSSVDDHMLARIKEEVGAVVAHDLAELLDR